MKKLNLFLLTLVTLLALTSFSGKDKVFNNADKWIPADFDPRKTTLVIEFDFAPNSLAPKAPEIARKNMAEYMQEKYPYKFEVVSDSFYDKISSKYADKDQYRYVLVGKLLLIQGSSYSYSVTDFHIWDRKLDKHYPETGKGSGYAITTFKPMINTILKFLSEKK